jgi:hypothetical protein
MVVDVRGRGRRPSLHGGGGGAGSTTPTHWLSTRRCTTVCLDYEFTFSHTPCRSRSLKVSASPSLRAFRKTRT